MSKAKQKITAAMIREAIMKRWAPPEYAVMFEVGNATGYAVNRHADAVIMSLWPSRGLELHGVEIKVSRSDWKREAADPEKAEEIAKYCDRWWVITAPGVIDDLSDVPPAWGVREYDGKRWRTLREAKITEAQPLSRGFLGAMLRRADKTMREDIAQAAKTAADLAEEEIKRRVDREVSMRERELRALNDSRSGVFKLVKKIKDDFGYDIGSIYDRSRFSDAFRLAVILSKNGIAGDSDSFVKVEAYLEDVARAVKDAQSALAKLMEDRSK